MRSLSTLFTLFLATPFLLAYAKDVADGKYKIVNRHSGKFLGVAYDLTEYGASVDQWTENGRKSQEWVITNKGNGYLIVNSYTDKALDIDNGYTDAGTDVIVWPVDSEHEINQRWTFKEVDDEYVIITNANADKVLDVDNESMEDGGNVLLWDVNGNGNQQWVLIPVDSSNNNDQYNPPENEQHQDDHYQDEHRQDEYRQDDHQQNDKSFEVVEINNDDDDNVVEVVNDHEEHHEEHREEQHEEHREEQHEEHREEHHEDSSCSQAILDKGYKCCSSNCNVIYTNEEGPWGSENGLWCGCGKLPSEDPCPASVTSQGNKCCTGNTDVIFTDERGKWGTEDGKWCVIIN